MSMVRIGPKYYRSALPVGKVEYETTFQHITLADQGRLGQQVYKFNLLLGYIGKDTSTYQQVYVINGHCRYKRYSLLDLAAYKVSQLLFGQRSKSNAQQPRG
jgi:hypothetical protein